MPDDDKQQNEDKSWKERRSYGKGRVRAIIQHIRENQDQQEESTEDAGNAVSR